MARPYLSHDHSDFQVLHRVLGPVVHRRHGCVRVCVGLTVNSQEPE
jgi:hypothetical protein